MASFLTILLLISALLDMLSAMIMGEVNQVAKQAFQLSLNVCLATLSTAILRLLGFRIPEFFWTAAGGGENDLQNVWLAQGLLLILVVCFAGPIYRRKAVIRRMFPDVPIRFYSRLLNNKWHIPMQVIFLALPLVVYGVIIISAGHFNYGIELEHCCHLPLNNSYAHWTPDSVAFVPISQPNWQWMAMFSASITNFILTGLFMVMNWRIYWSFIGYSLHLRHQNWGLFKRAMGIIMLMPVRVIGIFLICFCGSVFVSLSGTAGNAPMTAAEGLAFFFASVHASFCLMLVTTVLEVLLVRCSLVDQVHVYRQTGGNDMQRLFIVAHSRSSSDTDSTSFYIYYTLAFCGRGLVIQALIDQTLPAATYPRHPFASWDEIPLGIRVCLHQQNSSSADTAG